MAIIIPELVLHKLIVGILTHVRRDINNTVNDEQMIVYKLFHGLTNGKRDYFLEAKDLFSRTKEHPRKIESHIFFPKEQKGIPTINIILPGEQSTYNELGVGESGFEDDVFVNDSDTQYTPNYLRRFDGQLVVLITSDNAQETLLIYHLLKSMFISIFDTSELSGLQNIVLSGRDLAINEMNMPTHLFTRALSIKHMHEVEVPRLFSSAQISSLIIQGQASNSDNE